MILFGAELRFRPGRGADQAAGLAADLGFQGLAIGSFCTRAGALELVTAAAASGLGVRVTAAPLVERPPVPGKRLPFLGSLEDPEERRAAAELIATTLSAGVPLGIRTYTISFGDVALGIGPAELGRWFRRGEMDQGETGANALAAVMAERRARSPGIVDACRAGLDLIVPAVERTGATLAIELPAGPWGAPTPREASLLMDDYREAPIGVVWDEARMDVLGRLGLAPGRERAAHLAARTRLWRANEAIGIEIGYLPGQACAPVSRARIPTAPPAANGSEPAPIVVTGRPDSTPDEVQRALELVRARTRAPAATTAASSAPSPGRS